MKVGAYPSVEMKSVYAAAPADRTKIGFPQLILYIYIYRERERERERKRERVLNIMYYI